jgi:hypothetical protein
VFWLLLPLLAGAQGPGVLGRPQWLPDSALALQRARIDVEALCADSLAGRGYDSRQGHLRAARYIAQRFGQAGLAPGPTAALPTQGAAPLPAAAYFQPFSFSTHILDTAWVHFGRHKQHTLGHDILPAGYSGAGRCAWAFAPMPDSAAATQQAAQWFQTLLSQPPPTPNSGRPAGALVVPHPAPTTLEYSLPNGQVYRGEQALVAYAVLHGYPGLVLVKDKFTLVPASQGVPIPVLEVSRACWQHWQGIYTQAAVLTRGGTLEVAAATRTVHTQNVLGFLPGTNPAAPAIVLCAHYDHLGQVGPAIFRGANDNASGVAFLLSLADHFGAQWRMGRALPNTLVFAAFSGEEAGLHGSRHYTQYAPIPLERTAMVLNFDLMGYGEAGAMTVGGSTFTQHFDSLSALNARLGIAIELATRPNAPNSDHWHFTQAGVPGFFFYLMGGASHYHDVHDRPAALSLAGFWGLRRLMLAYVAETLPSLNRPPR